MSTLLKAQSFPLPNINNNTAIILTLHLSLLLVPGHEEELLSWSQGARKRFPAISRLENRISMLPGLVDRVDGTRHVLPVTLIPCE